MTRKQRKIKEMKTIISKALTISGSLGHCILEKRRPSSLALAKMFHVSS